MTSLPLTQRFRDLVLRTKISALLVLLTTVVALALSVSLYVLASAELHASLRQRLQHVAVTTALLVDGDALDAVQDETQRESEAYRALFAKLTAASAANGLKAVYTLRKTERPGIAEFVVDASATNRSTIGTPYNLAQAPAAVLGFEQPSTDAEIVLDEFGATLSGYAPVFRRDKTIAGLVGVDMDSSTVIEARQRFRATAATLFVALLAVALLLAVGFARIVTRPIETMTQAVETISAGNLERRMEIHSQDEIGRLSTAINRMVETLAVYLPVKLVSQILGGKSPLSLGGERTTATIFFSDIAGFTTISEGMKPDALVALMNEYLTAMSDVIEETAGTIDKYIGDAIMAFWGAPIPVADHAKLACEAALRQLAVHERLRVVWKAQGRPECLFRIGLNSGDIIVGNMGSTRRFNYTAMGDAVNLASRLEGAGKEYGVRVMVGETTQALVADQYEFRKLDRLTVKGKTVPVTVYELLGRKGELPGVAIAFRSAFEQGLECYFRQQWAEATTALEQARGMRPDDGPTALFLARVTELRAQSPGATWDGSFALQHK